MMMTKVRLRLRISLDILDPGDIMGTSHGDPDAATSDLRLNGD